MISFYCPSCGKHYTFSNKFAGRKLVCSACKTENVVPEPEEELGLAPEPEEELRLAPEPTSVEIASQPPTKSSGSPSLPPPLPTAEPDSSTFAVSIPVPPPLPPSHSYPPTPPVPPPLPSFPSSSTPPPVPSTFSSASSALSPVPPPVPPSYSEGSGSASPTGAIDLDSTILAYVFEDKKQADEAASQASPAPAPAKDELMELPKRRPWIYWTSILSMLLLLVGVSVYLALFVDWRPPDPRPQQLEGLYRLGSQAQIEANEKVSDSGKLRLQAQETWSLADKTIDSLVLTIAQIDDKQLDLRDAEAMLAAGGSQEQIAGMQKKKDEVQQSLAAAEGRLAELRKQAQENIMLASTSETDADRAANDVKVLRLESDYYKQQEEELKETIAARPDDREPAPLPMFDRDKNKLLLNETVSLSTDWTENYFRYFSFPDIDPERFFATYDTSRRFSGEKALRITSLEAKPIRILFPESKNAAADLSAMKYLSFALRFPEMTDSAAAGTTLDAGKIGEIRVRFCNSAGYVDIQTISPRFCEAVFYDGRGKFVAVDVPLTGDSHFWKRSENVDMKKFERRDDTIDSLLTRSVAQASLAETTDKEPTFFSRIDWIELRFIPLTNRTTFWIDGMLATEKRTRDPYDLLRAESSQAEQRKREAERLKNRRPITMFSTSERPPSKLNTDEEVEFHDEDSMHETDSDPKKAPDSQSKAGKDKSGNGAAVEMLEFPGTEEERIQRVLRWALQTAKGRARIVAGGERLSLGPKSKIPASIDLVEELDVAGFNRMTETDIDLICSLKGLKRLNLARTGLQNPVTAKLAVLNSLEYLNLAGNQLTFDALKPLQTLAALTDLNLDGIALSEKGIESLAMLKNLKTLSLNRSMVGSGDLLYLAPLAQLETLSLTASKVGNRGLQYLKTVPSLKTLDLSKTDVSDPGMPSLVELKNLQTLIVDGTALTDACLNDLARIPKLTIVSAVNTKITAQGVRQTLGGQWIDRIKTDTAP